MFRTLTTYGLFTMIWGPWLGPTLATVALMAPQPEQRILGVVVPFKRRA